MNEVATGEDEGAIHFRERAEAGAKSVGCSATDAEDVAQDAYLRTALRHGKAWFEENSRNYVAGCGYITGQRFGRNLLTRTKVLYPIEPDLFEAPSGVRNSEATAEEARIISDQIRSLFGADKEQMFLQYKMEGLSRETVGRIHDVSPATVGRTCSKISKTIGAWIPPHIVAKVFGLVAAAVGVLIVRSMKE